jgi:molybdopterin synthase sulfur carrier subunit
VSKDRKIDYTVEVTVAPSMRKRVGGASTVQTQGETVGQVLENLDREFPGFKKFVINKWGELRPSILVFLNRVDIRSLQGLKTPLNHGDRMDIYVLLSGG